MVARALLALLCLLSALGGPGPVLCFERDGDCAARPAEAPGPLSCHDQALPIAPGCASCTDVPTPEESLIRSTHAVPDQEVPAMAPAVEGPAVDASAFGSRAHALSLFRPDPTPAFVRTTVLLI